MLNNPLILRYRYNLMRPRKFWIYVTVYVSVIILILLLNYIAYKQREMFTRPINFSRNVFLHLTVLQILVLCLLSAINSGSAIKQEVIGNSYDFFRMLPISASKKTIGILVGKNLIMLLFAAANFLLLTIFGIYRQINMLELMQNFFALICISLFINSTVLLSSINKISNKKSSNTAVIILLCLLLSPLLFRYFTAIDKLGEITSKFYTIEMPSTILVGLVMLYFSCWSIAGILRKFTLEDEPLFSRIRAFLFMLGFEFVCLGLFYTYLTKENTTYIWPVNYLYWLISLLPVLLVPLGSLRRFDKYLEHSGLIQDKSGGKNMMIRMLMYSNLSLGLGLFSIWIVGAVGTTLIAGLKLLPCLHIILVLFSFYLFLFLLLELKVVYTSLSNKAGLLLGFITAVYIILPLILEGILPKHNYFDLFSPAGFIFSLFRESLKRIDIRNSIWITNFILCIIPILLILKRHIYILNMRRKM
ncbi:MAG: hypothetical protein JW715_07615 [Sedimentisphaerales bacterium]|nr:hypothetical protein [Sedimentisphaerales bacterium]